MGDEHAYAAMLKDQPRMVRVTVGELYLGTHSRRTYNTRVLQEEGEGRFEDLRAPNAFTAGSRVDALLKAVCVLLGYAVEDVVEGLRIDRASEDLAREVGWFVVFLENAKYKSNVRNCPKKGKTFKLWASKPTDPKPAFLHVLKCNVCLREFARRGFGQVTRRLAATALGEGRRVATPVERPLQWSAGAGAPGAAPEPAVAPGAAALAPAPVRRAAPGAPPEQTATTARHGVRGSRGGGGCQAACPASGFLQTRCGCRWRTGSEDPENRMSL